MRRKEVHLPPGGYVLRASKGTKQGCLIFACLTMVSAIICLIVQLTFDVDLWALFGCAVAISAVLFFCVYYYQVSYIAVCGDSVTVCDWPLKPRYCLLTDVTGYRFQPTKNSSQLALYCGEQCILKFSDNGYDMGRLLDDIKVCNYPPQMLYGEALTKYRVGARFHKWYEFLIIGVMVFLSAAMWTETFPALPDMSTILILVVSFCVMQITVFLTTKRDFLLVDGTNLTYVPFLGKPRHTTFSDLRVEPNPAFPIGRALLLRYGDGRIFAKLRQDSENFFLLGLTLEQNGFFCENIFPRI